MRVEMTERFTRNFRAAPPEIHKLFGKQLAAILTNFRHPALRAKKHPERGPDVWQARVDRAWRVYFRIREDTLLLIDIASHPK